MAGNHLTQFGQASEADIAAARHLYRLPDSFILTVSARRPHDNHHENHEVLLRALPEIPGHIGLVIVGAPDSLPALIRELNLESRVHLIPQVAEQHLPAVYQAASVFASPSLTGPGRPSLTDHGLPAIPVLEAMAAGVPVVTSDTGVTGRSAIKVPPRYQAGWAWALTAVLTNPALAAHLTEAGRTAAAAHLTKTRPLTLIA